MFRGEYPPKAAEAGLLQADFLGEHPTLGPTVGMARGGGRAPNSLLGLD